MSEQPSLEALWALVQEQRAEIEGQRVEIEGLRAEVRGRISDALPVPLEADTPRSASAGDRVSRAGLFKLAAVGAAGAVGLSTSEPAAASGCYGTVFGTRFEATGDDPGLGCPPLSGTVGYTTRAYCLYGGILSGTRIGIHGYAFTPPEDPKGHPPFVPPSGQYGVFGTYIEAGVYGEGVHGKGFGSGTGVAGESPGGMGVWGTSSSSDGVHGDSTTGVGVYGASNGYIGVVGSSASSASYAVYGGNTNNGWGVIGKSFNGAGGVLGSGIGVEGDSGSGVGVQGTSAGGSGVRGTSTDGSGAQGTSTNSSGVLGTSTNSSGVSGISHAGTDYGVYGVNDSGVDGSAGVTGTSLKSDGTPGAGIGVQGFSGSGNGIAGSSASGTGIVASSGSYLALQASSANAVGASAYAFNTANGWGVIGRSYADNQVTPGSGIGVEGDSGSGTGVKGASSSGVGMYGTSSSYIGTLGTTASSTSFGIYGSNTANGVGVVGKSYSGNSGTLGSGIGVEGDSGSGSGVRGTSDSGSGVYGSGGSGGYGGQFEIAPVGLAQLRLVPGSGSGHPTAGMHRAGELYMDSAAALFICQLDGSPGTWRQVPYAVATDSRVAHFMARRDGDVVRFSWTMADGGHGVAGFELYSGGKRLNRRVIAAHAGRDYRRTVRGAGNGPYVLHIVMTDGRVLSVHPA